MSFSTLVRKDLILLDIEAADNFEALTYMSTVLLEKGYVLPSFERAILERERLHPSGLPMEGHKIAIPHTNAEHVVNSALLFARLKRPVVFKCMGDPGISFELRLISMFALKEAKKIGDLLESLINVYRNNAALETILNAESEEEVYEILKTNISKEEV
jgi:galactitol PTS system EIIA component